MVNPGWMKKKSPFHEGELKIQTKLGIKDALDRQGRRIIRAYLTKQHQQFFAQLSYIVIATVDQFGYPWASIAVGQPGFISSPNDRTLQVSTKILRGDPLADNLAIGIDIGILGIELHSRRRNRLNGTVTAIADDFFEVKVSQSFGNCPQYIQARSFAYIAAGENKPDGKEITDFGRSEYNLISSADTFFIATAYQTESADLTTGVDASHRGGKPGFVRLDDQRTLTIPDFSGNRHFNTIGNLEMNPYAGLLFLNFESGDLLYLTGVAEVIWSETEIRTYAGAERLIRFHLHRGYRVNQSLSLSSSAPEFSPFLKHTGSW